VLEENDHPVPLITLEQVEEENERQPTNPSKNSH